ncbi:MAG: hypothetical protein DMG36_00475 [Acidobacteria bacterium]|nr:MAG: hypothetical protein DMG36_00475 [Acidobacteriota bacterium]
MKLPPRPRHNQPWLFADCIYNASPMLTLLAISNYRSLRNPVVPLKALNVITGANGSGISGLKRWTFPYGIGRAASCSNR